MRIDQPAECIGESGWLKRCTSARFEISDLELEKKELIELILTFGQTAGLTYSKYY